MERSRAENCSDVQLAEIVRHEAGFVACVLRRFGVRSCDIDDARQDVFVVVHRRLPEFEPRGAASRRSWLYRICVCVAADYRKRAHRRRERLGEELIETAREARAERIAIAQQLADELQAALARLDPLKRQVFELYEFEELTIAEVAAQLGCPLKTAFSRLYAARKTLRAELRRAGYAALPALLLWLPPWRAQAASLPIAKLMAATCAASALAIVITGMPAQPRTLSASFSGVAHEPDVTPLLPADALRAPALVPAPQVEPAPRAVLPRTRAKAGPTATAQPVRSTPWILPPDSPAAPETRPAPAVGLDEVLSATSIRPLLKIGRARQAFVLVPKP